MQDENLSPRSLAALIAKRQRGGDSLKSLIAPPTYEFNNATVQSIDKSLQKNSPSSQSWTTCSGSPSSSKNLKKKPKNHLRANREALKEKQRNIKDIELERSANEKLRLQKLEQKKQKLFGNVRSKILDPSASSVSTQSEHSRHSAPRNKLHMASQIPKRQNIAIGEKAPSLKPDTNAQSGVTSSSSSSSNDRHKSFGKVPRYITDRKAKIEQEEEDMRLLKENKPPAPGLVLMEESERLETLRMLEANEKEARDALISIPFRMNEKRAARLRQAVEYRLKEIEDTRKIFSKDKVFVTKNDA